MSDAEIAQRSTRGSFALFAGNFLSAVMSFVSILFIARLLGPSEYGVYTLSVLIPTILLNFLGFGVNSGVTRFAAYNLSQGKFDVARRMALNGAIFVLLFGVLLSAIDLLAAQSIAQSVLHRPDIVPLLRFSSILIFSQAIFQSGVAALLGWSFMGRIGATYIVQSTLRLVIVVPLLLIGYEVYGALVAYALSVSLGGILAYAFLFQAMRAGADVSRGQFLSDIRTLLSYGGELFVGSLATSASAQYVVLLLAIIASNTSVGYYQSASNFVSTITLVSSAISQALFPAFAHLQGAKSDVKRAFTYATKYMGFAVTPIVFLLIGASLQIIRLPLGASYSTASTYLSLLALSNIFLLFGLGVLPSFFNGLGHPRYYMVLSLAAATVTFALAPILAIGVGLGVVGLILSILVSNFVAVVTGLYLASRFFGAHLDYRASLLILISCLLAYLGVVGISMLRFSDLVLLPTEIVVFAAIYLTAAPLLSALTAEDLKILRDAVHGLGRFEIVVRPILRYEGVILRVAGKDR